MHWTQGAALVVIATTLAIAEPAVGAPEQLKGMRFIGVMQGNTVSGTRASGAGFNLYFVAGGEVSYEDSSGARDRGRWQMDPEGDVGITWRERQPDHESTAIG